LELERQGILTQIEKDAIKDRLDAQKEAIDKWKKFQDELNNIVEMVLDKMIEINKRRIESDQNAVDNQREAVETQQRRAEQGLANTLAFEQQQLAKREADLIKQQKREERLQKIKALWSSYSSYSDKDPDTAIMKALRDFSIIEAITASFGDGGVVEDKLPTNGIFRGQSHQGNKRGIPILVEGQEGIFSKREMANLGKDNFYKMKERASMGKVDSNFFGGQRKKFMRTMTKTETDPRLLEKMDGVKKAIEDKPVQNWDMIGFVDGMMKVIEETHVKNKVSRNHFKVRKPRP
jgi:hypothetical protein